MNFLNLEYFIIIAEERSFSRASERLYISQQSLSEHIKKLEASLGVTLFIRGRTLALTEAGECFLQGAKEILATRDQMLRNISSLNTRFPSSNKHRRMFSPIYRTSIFISVSYRRITGWSTVVWQKTGFV